MKHLVLLLLVICVIGVNAIRNCTKLYLQHGTVEISNKGRIANFSCDPKYVLDGYNVSVCIGRKWSHPLPECIRVGNSSITNNETTLRPDENNSTVNMTTQKMVTMETTTANKTEATVSSTNINLQNTSKSAVTNVSYTSKTTESTKKTTLQTVTMSTDITMETTYFLVIENTPLVTHMVTVTTEKKSNGNKYLFIGLTCVVIVAVCVIIVIIWYRRRQKMSRRSSDKVQLVSRTDSEEHEEWSLLV